MRLASTEIIADAVSYAHQDLDRAANLWQFVSEQKLVGPTFGGHVIIEGNGGFGVSDTPTAPAGLDLSKLPMPKTSADWVGEQVAAGRLQVETLDKLAQLMLLDALVRLRDHAAGMEDAIRRVRTARVALGAQVPAIDAALNAHASTSRKHPGIGVGPDGRPGTSGVSLDEADMKRRGAVEAEASCLACDLGVSEVGRLRAGLCNTDYQAWRRAGMPDRPMWITARRSELARANRDPEVPDDLAERRVRLQAVGLPEDLAA